MTTTRILGVDPGSRVTGWGVIESSGARVRYIAHDCIRCERGELPARLSRIFSELATVVQTYQPDETAIEEVFVNRNISSALILGQARGAAICALANTGLSVAEYAPAQIKSAIVGNGRAEKLQVQHMVKVLLNLRETVAADAADALAIALCHAHVRTTVARTGEALRGAWGRAVEKLGKSA
ncbi:MAG: crossover junction endodeoxyribonuclease RuvC [Nevskia sp.]|nr:crossover junction endodeoxyribonuclease RuvC [Nevskia sp.]MCK9385295.1 crossover junction endodeoxyribonuclease RuvC [Nevskia sp.]